MGSRLRKWLLAAGAAVVMLAMGCLWGWRTIREGESRAPQIMAQSAEILAAGDACRLTPERVDMLLKVEDPGFYRHNGVDVFTPGSGMTTLTQALVKRFYFEAFHQGLLPKLKQSLYAVGFNRVVSKPDQLRLYLGSVYMGTIDGREVHGFQDAGQTFFQHSCDQLTPDEYLAIIAMPVGPNTYSAKLHPVANRQRAARIRKFLAGACSPASVFDVYYKNCD